MQKIPTVFQRNHDTDHLVRDEVTPGCEWVLAGEGVATKKYDGTCCRVLKGELWKRYELKPGRVPPPGFEPAQEVDAITGKCPGWVPFDRKTDRWHLEAWQCCGKGEELEDGTYELCGPKINGNPEGFTEHLLIKHGIMPRHNVPCDFAGLKEYLRHDPIEGMAKLKLRDFGFTRPLPGA